MNKITSFLSAFVLGGIMLGALYMLIPSGSMKKTVKYGFCICFIAVIVFSFGLLNKINIKFSVPDFETEIEEVGEKSAKAVFSAALKKEGINFSDLEVITSKNETGGIDIIEVIIKTECSLERIEQIIGNENIKVSVINE